MFGEGRIGGEGKSRKSRNSLWPTPSSRTAFPEKIRPDLVGNFSASMRLATTSARFPQTEGKALTVITTRFRPIFSQKGGKGEDDINVEPVCPLV